MASKKCSGLELDEAFYKEETGGRMGLDQQEDVLSDGVGGAS